MTKPRLYATSQEIFLFTDYGNGGSLIYRPHWRSARFWAAPRNLLLTLQPVPIIRGDESLYTFNSTYAIWTPPCTT